MDDHEDHEQDSALPPPAAVAGLDTVTAAFAAADDVGQLALRLGSTAIVAARTAEAVLPLVVAARSTASAISAAASPASRRPGISTAPACPPSPSSETR